MASSENAPLPRRALLSVADPTALGELPELLHARGTQLLATGGTAAALRARGLEVTSVEEFTGLGTMLGGRVKTLHPLLHGGILAREGRDDADITRHGLTLIDLVAVSLYPFEETLSRRERGKAAIVLDEELIERIDIGGVALLRAAAKNHARVTVLAGSEDFVAYATLLQEGRGATELERRRFAAHAFAHTAYYDAVIARALATAPRPSLSTTEVLALKQRVTLRYGENPHQQAALYTVAGEAFAGLAHAEILQGTLPSYNNYLDADVAWRAVHGSDSPACVIVKHASPAAAAIAETAVDAWQRAHAADPVSSFGGVVAFNRPIDSSLATALTAPGLFLEAVVAPDVLTDARERLGARSRLRVFRVPTDPGCEDRELRRIDGGYLLQTRDTIAINRTKWRHVTRAVAPEELGADLALAWWIVRFLPSNAIAVVRDRATLGVGGGQPNRVDAVRIAVDRAHRLGHETHGAVLASDGFFPFPDALEEAARAGIEVVIQPGGSKRDEDVIATADRLGLAMIFTDERHFRH